MRRRRNPLIWQGIILVIMLAFVAYGAYHLILNLTKTNVTDKAVNSNQVSVKVANLERQIKSVQSENTLLEKELATANDRISKLEKQIKGIDNIMATLSNPFAPGDEITTEESVKKGTVSITPLNVRKAANQNSTKVGSLTKGTKVQILEEKKVSGATWYKISTDDYNGWVHGDYIKIR